ncbi:MAG: 4Fe-4S dicluster domain-containing protein [Dissulfurispiraceae bacterium]|jgi:DMSO reductase family type II enzyme iron-sulfur subunit|nr:4Fe-4S dicluster domain-containing protein [Dissulfurispiraceae bacterium]
MSKESMKMMKTPDKQLTFVINLNKCLGCQTCTVACKRLWTSNEGQDYMYWRHVETAPGLGYPKNRRAKGGGYKNGKLQLSKLPEKESYGIPFEFDFAGRLMEGKKERVRPKPTADWAPNWDEEQGKGQYPNTYYFYLPLMCNHCTKPACLEACPVDAIYKRKEDGIVLIDQQKCVGAQECIRACPYAKIYFNQAVTKSNKCIGCYPRIEKGVSPACVAQCPGRAMHVGFREDKNSGVYKLVNEWKVALPLMSEAGTGPNVFYIPQVLGPSLEDAQGNLTNQSRIPIAYQQELFGKNAARALKTLESEREKRINGKPSALMDMLIGYKCSDMQQISGKK